MRVMTWMAAAVALSLTTPVFAQGEWDNFKFAEDGFEVNFPGKPKVENTTYMSQYRYSLPAKVRHGAMITISRQQYDAFARRFGIDKDGQ